MAPRSDGLVLYTPRKHYMPSGNDYVLVTRLFGTLESQEATKYANIVAEWRKRREARERERVLDSISGWLENLGAAEDSLEEVIETLRDRKYADYDEHED